MAAAAKAPEVTQQTINNLVNGKSGVSLEMAVRLGKAFGGSAEMWLRLKQI
jgi:antitoxin HigA-1